jgi:hypothetical protein
MLIACTCLNPSLLCNFQSLHASKLYKIWFQLCFNFYGFLGEGRGGGKWRGFGVFLGLFPMCSHPVWNLFPQSGSRSSHCVPIQFGTCFPMRFPKFSLCSHPVWNLFPHEVPEVLTVFPMWFPNISLLFCQINWKCNNNALS